MKVKPVNGILSCLGYGNLVFLLEKGRFVAGVNRH